MLTSYLFAFIGSFISCSFVCFLFKKLNILDLPDGVRKIHKGEVALGGGLALFISWLLIIFLIYPDLFSSENTLFIIIIASSLVLLIGLIDDIKPLPVSIRLIVQILASWLVILLTDIYIRDLGDLLGLGNIYLGQLGIPITIFMVVGICNAFNMLDGIDGGTTLIALAALIALAVLTQIQNIPGLDFIFTVGLFTFLFFNLGIFGKKWKMFLGDSGAMWLGFIVAWFLVALSQGEDQILRPVTALWLVLLPLIDALSTFLARLWVGRPIFSGDRTHLHHILLGIGLKKWKVILIFIIISISSATLAVYSSLFFIKEYFLFYGFLTIWFFYFLLTKYPITTNKSNSSEF